MPRRVDVEIQRGGQLRVEFSGFAGEDCFQEAEAIVKALRELGLWAIPVAVVAKTSEEIAREVEIDEDNRKKVPVP